MKLIQLSETHDITDMQAKLVPESYEPQFMLDGHEAVHVVKPNGDTLLKYIPDFFGTYATALAPIVRTMAAGTDARMTAAGEEANKASVRTDATNHRKKMDGTQSKTTAGAIVKSGIVGNFERTARRPFCRQTAYVLHNLQKWKKYIAFMQQADRGFREHLPDRHAAQQAYADATDPAWLVPNTCFTTATVNKNWQTALHQDAGDLEQGFGVMVCIRNNLYEGAELCFPAFSCGVNMQNGCLLLADVHEWHGNKPFRDVRAGFERLTNVMYYRKKMRECGSPAEELHRVQNRQAGEKL